VPSSPKSEAETLEGLEEVEIVSEAGQSAAADVPARKSESRRSILTKRQRGEVKR
jgi:hypothetical protein